MQLIPDIKLPDPDEFQLNYDADFFAFLDSCLPGLKFINIQRRSKQNKFEPPIKILLQEKPSVHQRPHEKSEEICLTVMAVIQYDIESRDESGSYRVQCYRNTGTIKDSVKAKIINIDLEEQSAHINDYGRFKDDDEPPPLVSIQAQYIQMLQDQNIKNQSLVTGLMASLMEMFKSQQGTINDLMSKSVEIKRIESSERLREQEDINEFRLAEISQKNKTERWNNSMALLKDSGAIKKLGEVGAEVLQKKFLSGQPAVLPDPEMPLRDPRIKNINRPNFRGRNTVSENIPPVPTEQNDQKIDRQNQKIKGDELVVVNDKATETDEIIEIDEETKNEIDELVRREPLKCYISILNDQFTQEQAVNLKEILEEDLFNLFINLLTSDSEEEAKHNLLMIRGNITPNDVQKLVKAKKVFTEKQQTFIDKILMFEFDE